MARCEKDCTFIVHPHRDNPDDPTYPIVICPICMTRWYGHRDDNASKPLDPRLPAALRDAIILDQPEEAFRILEDDLGYSKAVRPNAIIGASTDVPILPTQSARISARPQCAGFLPTHFVTGSSGFLINDVRIGTSSMFIQANDIPSEAFRMNVSVVPEFRFRPGESIGDAFVDIVNDIDVDLLPTACSAFKWIPCRTALELIVVATNMSDVERPFYAWFLGRRSARFMSTEH